MTDNISAVLVESSARLHIRTKSSIKETIEKAAKLSGMSVNTFLVNAACLRAREIIAAHERTFLEPVDYAAFFDAIERRAAPTQKLTAAAKQHAKMILDSE